MVTWRPDTLTAAFRDSIDLTLATTGTPPAVANGAMAVSRATISAGGQQPRPFTVAHRVSPHARHQHNHIVTALPPHRRFYFHTNGETGGEPVTAATLEEFNEPHPALRPRHPRLPPIPRRILPLGHRHLADHSLGTVLAAIERDLGIRHVADLERARHRIIHAIDSRYPSIEEP